MSSTQDQVEIAEGSPCEDHSAEITANVHGADSMDTANVHQETHLFDENCYAT